MLPKKEITERQPRTKSPEEALSALMRLTARAERCEADALRLMRRWGLSEEDAQRILERLLKERFIDNSRYATLFVREKLNLSGWGEYKIRTALQRKQIAREIIDSTLRALSDRDKMAERLQQQLQRKVRTVKAENDYQRRTKLIRYGLSLGYPYEMVLEAVGGLIAETEPLCDDF